MSDQSDVVWVLDSAPLDNGAPVKFIAHREYAEALVAEAPDHRRIVSDNEPVPTVRSDGQSVRR